MKRLLSATAAAAILASAAPASAAVVFSFTPGAASPGVGYTVFNNFDNDDGIVGSLYEIKTAPSDSNGAPPGNSSPYGTSYLSVLGGGTATVTFAAPVSRFQFDWGSIDSYNTLTINSTGENPIIIPGTDFITPANGNQVAAGTNGLFTVWGDEGEMFTSITLTSSSNSFEIDNLATFGAVPEPTSWALMILGFGSAGAMLRRRRALVAA